VRAIYELGAAGLAVGNEVHGCPMVDIDRVSLPIVSGIAPRRGPASGPSRRVTMAPVTITGRGFADVTRVRFAGELAVFTVDSDTTITAIPPVGVRSGTIRLTTSDGRSTTAGRYTVTPPKRRSPA
jgi:hypothetical protein